MLYTNRASILDMQNKLRKLIFGLSDQENKVGHRFYYDGGELYPEDMANIVTPSVLCIAQCLSKQLGLGNLGFQFKIGQPNPIFPVEISEDSTSTSSFALVAPLATEVFLNDVVLYRADLTQLYFKAASIITEYSHIALTDRLGKAIEVNQESLETKILGNP